MAIGTSIFLLAVGAILRFAIYYSVRGASLEVIGVILMIAGALGLVLSFTVFGVGSSRMRRTRTVADSATGTTRTTVDDVTTTDSVPR